MRLIEFITKINEIINSYDMLTISKMFIKCDEDSNINEICLHSSRSDYKALGIYIKGKSNTLYDLLNSLYKYKNENLYQKGYIDGYFLVSDDMKIYASDKIDIGGKKLKDIIIENNTIILTTY